jgi:hypothetical protein
MRGLALVLIGACSREPAPRKEAPAGGSYKDLVTSAQTGSATERRDAIACSQRFVELSRQPYKPLPATEGHCRQGDLEARFRCFDARDAHLATLAGDALWREADDGELVPAVFARIVAAREAGVTLTGAEQELFAAYVFDAEVRNGGFHQYFYNSSGDLALVARDGLRRFEMPQAHALLDCALTAFPDHKPSTDREARIQELARWGDRQFEVFSVVTDAYYAINDEEWVRAKRYVRAHREELPHAQQARN